MTKEEYEEYLDETDLDEEEFDAEYEKESTEGYIPSNRTEQDAFEEAKEFYRRDNGNRVLNPSKIFGTLIGMIAVAAHVIHTFVANVFFGKYEQFAIREAFMRGLGKLGEPGEVSTKENYEEEPSIKKQEERKCNISKEVDKERNENEKREKPNSQEEKSASNVFHRIKKASIPNRISKEPTCVYEEKDIAVLKSLFNIPSIQHVFTLNGYLIDTIPNKNKAFLFEYKEGKVDGIARGFQASELYNRKYNGMLHAVQEIDQTSSIEAALKTCAICSGMMLCAQEVSKSNNEEIDLLSDNNELACVDIETEYGCDTLSFYINREDSSQICVSYNDRFVGKIEAERLYKEPFENYKKELLNSIQKRSRREVDLGDDVKISWNNNKNEISIYKKDIAIGTFSFQSSKDIGPLVEALKENDIFLIRKKNQECITIQPESLAYTLAILTNPDMEIEHTSDGMCINPITHEAEPSGKSHIYAVRHNNGVEVKAFLPTLEEPDRHFNLCSFTSRNQLLDTYICELAASIQETSRVLEQIPDIDVSYKRIQVKKTSITALKPEKEDLSSDLLHGLYDKCRREIAFGDTVIPTTISLDQIKDDLKEAFGADFKDTQEQTEDQFQTVPMKYTEEPELNEPSELDEEQIENTSLFIPAYDEER